ncbi:MAG: hypothetical protein ACK4N5_02515 [Myxococcales bacterium]
MKLVRVIGIALCALSLTACANRIESKEDAARAMQRIGAAGNAAGNRQGQLPGPAAGQELSITVPGKTGTATVTIKAIEATADGLKLTEQIVYKEFSADGENTLDGTLDLVITAKFEFTDTTGSATIVMAMKGTVEMTGEYDSTVSFDLRMTSSTNDLRNQSGATIKVVMDGTVTADGKTFTYDNETIAVETVKAS